MAERVSVRDTWTDLHRSDERSVDRFDPATTEALPPAARRWLCRTLPAGTPLAHCVDLEMDGTIRLGSRWLRFRARQVLRAGEGFVWAPTVGGRFVRFSGADLLGRRAAQTKFNLYGIVPIVRSAGVDVERSAEGRLAAETVAWLPHALTPQCGAGWTHVDDNRAVVEVAVPSGSIDVQVEVSAEGDLRALQLDRWSTETRPPALRSFGASISDILQTTGGVRIAESGSVAWDLDAAAGRDDFYRFRVADVSFSAP